MNDASARLFMIKSHFAEVARTPDEVVVEAVAIWTAIDDILRMFTLAGRIERLSVPR